MLIAFKGYLSRVYVYTYINFYVHVFHNFLWKWASLMVRTVKNLPAVWETWVNPWVEKIPWRREWQPTPVFLPGEFHGQRSLVGYSSWSCKALDMTEWLTYTHINIKINKILYIYLYTFSPIFVYLLIIGEQKLPSQSVSLLCRLFGTENKSRPKRLRKKLCPFP